MSVIRSAAPESTHFIIDSVDNQEQMARFIRAACDELSVPKPKKKKE